MAVSWLTWAVLLTAVGLFIAWMLRPDPSLPPRVPAADTDYTRKPGLSGLMPLHAPATGLRYVVIGTGSVGLRMVDALLERGEAHVVGVDVAPPRRIPPGMKFVRASATDYAAVRAALDGADVCFATFALIRPWERLACLYGPSHAVNVAGTENVVRACADAGVRVLVHTSTSNVAVSPKLPMRMLLDESAPTVDARTTANHYSWTKAQAERAVLRANGTPLPAGRGLLATGSIRPCSGLFGPEDVNLCERWLSAEHAYVTAGNQVIDWVYVDDVVWGHLLLERSLLHNPTRAGGEAFCISHDEPLAFVHLLQSVKYFHERMTQRPMTVGALPPHAMDVLSFFVELVTWLRGRTIHADVGKLTAPMLAITRLSYSFSTEKARKLLGFRPLYSVDEAVQRTVAMYLRSQRRAAGAKDGQGSAWNGMH